MAWHGWAWQGKARQGSARLGKAWHGWAWQGKARRGEVFNGLRICNIGWAALQNRLYRWQPIEKIKGFADGIGISAGIGSDNRNGDAGRFRR